MAKSRFEYVRNFELPDPLIPNTFAVVRIDGRGFHKFSDAHDFVKPNDVRALHLMDRAARSVMEDMGDVVLAFGESDEYSFLIRRASQVYNRRRSKINSAVCSIFTSAYVFHWSTYFPDKPLRYPPTFDSRVVLYPGVQEVRDYFAWRQADTHINNLQNTTFWAFVNSGLSTTEANKAMQGTDSKGKNEVLFSQFGINYNTLPAMFRKGSILVREEAPEAGPSRQSNTQPDSAGIESRAAVDDGGGADLTEEGVAALELSSGVDGAEGDTPEVTASSTPAGVRPRSKRGKRVKPYEGLTGQIVVLHEDLIRDAFWSQRPWLLM